VLGASTPVFAPLCLDPLTARLAESLGYQFGYLSGGALGYSYAVSEALLTLTEICDATRRIAQRSGLGVIVDGGVGFGDPVHVARAIWEIEASGAVAVELEDQVAPKRVSHHRGIEHLVPAELMAAKIEQAVHARNSDTFLIIARTGAVKNESFQMALDRLRIYRDAGADLLMFMPEQSSQVAEVRSKLQVPLATLASFAARPREQWSRLGWDLVIDPFTAQVLAFAAVRDAYAGFQNGDGTGVDAAALFATYRELPVERHRRTCGHPAGKPQRRSALPSAFPGHCWT
jgi:methylisocitrate lyase